MRKYDTLSGIFLLALSTAICIGSSLLHVGTLTAPGAGLFPLACGLVLALFSALILVQAQKASREPVRFWSAGANRKEILLTSLFVLIYALILERLGFLGTSILFFLLISRLVFGNRWTSTAFFALVASFATYLVFRVLLHAPLPPGVLEGMF
jgi:putative tricarboxylic transport membrane protein